MSVGKWGKESKRLSVLLSCSRYNESGKKRSIFLSLQLNFHYLYHTTEGRKHILEYLVDLDWIGCFGLWWDAPTKISSSLDVVVCGIGIWWVFFFWLFEVNDSDFSKDDQVAAVFSFTFHCIISRFHSEIQKFLLEKKEKEIEKLDCSQDLKNSLCKDCAYTVYHFSLPHV